VRTSSPILPEMKKEHVYLAKTVAKSATSQKMKMTNPYN
jgi:hypothetical protein